MSIRSWWRRLRLGSPRPGLREWCQIFSVPSRRDCGGVLTMPGHFRGLVYVRDPRGNGGYMVPPDVAPDLEKFLLEVKR